MPDDRPATAGRELRFLLLGLLAGGVVLPFLVYAVGAATLGPYDGGLGAFLRTLADALGHFAPAAWALVLGPYALFQAVRLLTRPLRRRSAEA
jgi:hypothetical protein